jgi:hypothetical protein
MSTALALTETNAPLFRRDTFDGREQTLAKLDHVLALLTDVRHVQDAKQILDITKAARVYAREQKLGQDVITKGRAVMYEALRRIGELLQGTDRNTGTQGQLVGPGIIGPTNSEGPMPPTLAELGIDYKTSSIAQQLAALSPADFERVRDGREKLADVQLRIRRLDEWVVSMRLREQDAYTPDLRVCSCVELFASGIQPDAVITEPPRRREHLAAFSELAQACANVPLVAVRMMSGQTDLPEVLQRLCAHLTYRSFQARYGLILLFVQDEGAFERAKERVKARARGSGLYDWEDFVQTLAAPGELICDPFMRKESPILLAALEHRRRFVGCSVDADVIAEIRQRKGAAA